MISLVGYILAAPEIAGLNRFAFLNLFPHQIIGSMKNLVRKQVVLWTPKAFDKRLKCFNRLPPFLKAKEIVFLFPVLYLPEQKVNNIIADNFLQIFVFPRGLDRYLGSSFELR
jgi:hypothetical protein